jgi:hypothetical protein
LKTPAVRRDEPVCAAAAFPAAKFLPFTSSFFPARPQWMPYIFSNLALADGVLSLST